MEDTRASVKSKADDKHADDYLCPKNTIEHGPVATIVTSHCYTDKAEDKEWTKWENDGDSTSLSV